MIDFLITLGMVICGLILPAVFIAWVNGRIDRDEKKN